MLRKHIRHRFARATECTCHALEPRVLLSLAPTGPEFRVNTFTTGGQQDPAIAMDGAGNSIVTWVSSAQDGSVAGIYAQLYHASGDPRGSEFRVNTATADDQLRPAVAMDGDGDFVIVWDSNLQDGSGYGVYAQRYDAAGSAWGVEFRVNTYTTSDQRRASVAMDVVGNFVITWNSNQDGSGHGIYAQRYDRFGAPAGQEFRVNTHTASTQAFPSAAMDADGDFVIAWQSLNQDGSDYGIYAQRYDAAGVPRGAEFRVNTHTSGVQSLSSVAMSAGGEFVVSWRGEGSGDTFGIFARRYTATGTPVGDQFRVNTFTTGNQNQAAVAMDANGNVLVSWQSNGQDGSGYGVYAQQYSPAGVPLGPEFQVTTHTTNGQTAPAVSMDPDGDAVIAWVSSGQDGSGNGVYAQRYSGPADIAAPMITDIRANGQTIVPWQTVPFDFGGFNIGFTEAATPSALNPANWLVTRDGVEVPINASSFQTIIDVEGRARVAFALTTSYSSGNFTIIARDAIKDAAGNALDGDRDGVPGGHLALSFSRGAGGPPVNPHASNSGSQVEPAVAVNASGASVAVWNGSGPEGIGIYVRRFDSAGMPLAPEFRADTLTTSHFHPTVAMHDNGSFIVAFGDFSTNTLFARRFNATGTPLGAQFMVSSMGNFFGLPNVGIANDGSFVVSWWGGGPYFRQYDANGNPLGGERFPSNPQNISRSGGSVAVAQDGSFVLSWQDGSPLTGLDGPRAQRYSAAGVAQGDVIHVHDFEAGNFGGQLLTSTAIDATGRFAVTFNGPIDGAGPFAGWRRYDTVGNPQGVLYRPAFSGTFGNISYLSSGMDAGGTLTVSFARNTDLWVAQQNEYGTPLGTTTRLETNLRANSLPRIVVGANGDVVGAWTKTATDADAFIQFYRPDVTPTVGALVDAPDPVPQGTPLTLTASGVTDDGTVESVSFYRESNGIAGLQVGAFGDTLVGTDTNGANGWSLVVPTGSLTPGSSTYWAQGTDDQGLTGTPASTVNTIVPAAPVVTNSDFLFATLPQRLSFTFNQNVGPSLGLDDIVVQQLPGGPTVTPSGLTYDAQTNTATFTFNSALPDGSFRARLISGGISGPGGTLPDDHVFEFTFLRGDANGDGRVNLTDFNILAANFGQSGRDFTQGDFSYDGQVNLADFNILAGRFGVVLGSQSAQRDLKLTSFANEVINDNTDALSDLLT